MKPITLRAAMPAALAQAFAGDETDHEKIKAMVRDAMAAGTIADYEFRKIPILVRQSDYRDSWIRERIERRAKEEGREIQTVPDEYLRRVQATGDKPAHWALDEQYDPDLIPDADNAAPARAGVVYERRPAPHEYGDQAYRRFVEGAEREARALGKVVQWIPADLMDRAIKGDWANLGAIVISRGEARNAAVYRAARLVAEATQLPIRIRAHRRDVPERVVWRDMDKERGDEIRNAARSTGANVVESTWAENPNVLEASARVTGRT